MKCSLPCQETFSSLPGSEAFISSTQKKRSKEDVTLRSECYKPGVWLVGRQTRALCALGRVCLPTPSLPCLLYAFCARLSQIPLWRSGSDPTGLYPPTHRMVFMASLAKEGVANQRMQGRTDLVQRSVATAFGQSAEAGAE